MAKTYPHSRAPLMQAFVGLNHQKCLHRAFSTISAASSVQMPRSLEVCASSSQTPSGFRKPETIEWKEGMPTNKASFIGLVSREVRIRYLDSGKIVADSSIQVTRRLKDDSWFYLEFWGDLAEVAAAHVRVHDTISVSGSVWSEKALGKDGLEKTFAKVVAADLKFVKTLHADESATQANKMSWTELWENLFDNPSDWFDYRNQKVSDQSPDFKHKFSRQALWLDNKNTPSWVMERLMNGAGLKFQHDRSLDEKWEDFFSDPTRWWDNRFDKLRSNSPDFQHKDTRESLWIDNKRNPQWIKAKLESLSKLSKPSTQRYKGKSMDW